MDENATKNNCFWPTNVHKKTKSARSQNEVFLYDEAEPLAYGCSETSLPPKQTTKDTSNRSVEIRDDESMKTPSGVSESSAVCPNTSRYYSVVSLSKSAEKNVLGSTCFNRRKEPANFCRVDETNFQNAILCKYNEFSNSSKSLTQRETEYFKNSTDKRESTENASRSVKMVPRKNNNTVREIFTRKSPALESSSDSEFSQSRESELDEVFSTGASEIADEACRVRGKTTDRVRQQTSEDSDVHLLTSKSIVKVVLGKGDAKTRRETHVDNKRVRPPQRKLSFKNINSKPCCLFVEEIKRNNLVMKEEIFSSSKSKNHVVSDSYLHHDKTPNEDGENRSKQQRSHEVRKGDMDVFEAKGCRARKPIKTPGIKNGKPVQLQSGLFEMPASEVKMSVPQTKCTERKTSGNTEQLKMPYSSIKEVKHPQQPLQMKSIGINTNESKLSNSLPIVHNSNESKSSKVITPTSHSSRYVKLPGFPEAFVKDDMNVKELRIKGGLSFESVNIFNSTKTTHDFSQNTIRFLEERTTNEDVPAVKQEERIEDIMKMKDQSTGFESPMEHRLTQTSNDMIEKIMADTSVQCESYIIDGNVSSDYKNDHQEIMICDDDGTGVQLYNILGHPLTDMEGYLLKDSHGRFLVRLDNFGVPTTCTDGRTIFLEDGTKWESIKGYFNIIHQRFKKNLAKSLERSKIKSKIDNRAKRPTEKVKAVNKLEWLRDISKYDTLSFGNSRSQCDFKKRNEHNPLRQIKFKPDSTNLYDNTSTLVAEMKSIAKLRNALLEKINFITDHRGPSQKPLFSTRNETLSYRSMKRSDMLPNPQETNWKSEPRIHADIGRIQRTGQKLKANRNDRERRDSDEERFRGFFKTTSNYRARSPQRIQENQKEFQGNTSVWRPQPAAALNTNNWWQPLESSNEMTFLRDENFPPASEHSSFEPWSDGSPSSSNVQLMTGKTQKWNAMRPSIEDDLEEHSF